MKLKKLILRFPPLDNYLVTVVVTDDVRRTAREWGIIGMRDVQAFVHRYNDARESLIVIGNTSTAGTVAHEAYHCVRAIMKSIGAKQENEIMAYHIGYLVDKILTIYTPRKSNRSQKSSI